MTVLIYTNRPLLRIIWYDKFTSLDNNDIIHYILLCPVGENRNLDGGPDCPYFLL